MAVGHRPGADERAPNQILTVTEHQAGATNAPSPGGVEAGRGAVQLTATGQTNLRYVFEGSHGPGAVDEDRGAHEPDRHGGVHARDLVGPSDSIACWCRETDVGFWIRDAGRPDARRPWWAPPGFGGKARSVAPLARRHSARVFTTHASGASPGRSPIGTSTTIAPGKRIAALGYYLAAPSGHRAGE